MKIEYNEIKDILKEIRALELKMKSLPRKTIEETYHYWYNINLNGVSPSMADSGGEHDPDLMRYFDTCYRYGRYGAAEEQRGEPNG